MLDNIALKALEINNLTYVYENGHKALDNINFNIEKSEFVAVVGQNGSGKSTLLKNIVGLLAPTYGNIYIDGSDDRNILNIAKKIGFVMQNPDRQLFCDTVENEIYLGLENFGFSKHQIKERLEQTITCFELESIRKEFPFALPKSKRMKIAIASVVAIGAEILILDEPTSGQDCDGCLMIMSIVKKLHAEGTTIIFVTHNMELVAEYANKVIVLDEGKILVDGNCKKAFEFITPPQITQLGIELSNAMPIGNKISLTVDELGTKILKSFKK